MDPSRCFPSSHGIHFQLVSTSGPTKQSTAGSLDKPTSLYTRSDPPRGSLLFFCPILINILHKGAGVQKQTWSLLCSKCSSGCTFQSQQKPKSLPCLLQWLLRTPPTYLFSICSHPLASSLYLKCDRHTHGLWFCSSLCLERLFTNFHMVHFLTYFRSLLRCHIHNVDLLLSPSLKLEMTSHPYLGISIFFHCLTSSVKIFIF